MKCTVAFISFVRVIYLDDLYQSADPDFSWTGASFGFLRIVELNAAIAAILTLKLLANRVFADTPYANSLQ